MYVKKFSRVVAVCLLTTGLWASQSLNTATFAVGDLDIEYVKSHPETFVKIRTDAPMVRYRYLPFYDTYLDLASLTPTEVYYPYFGATARLVRMTKSVSDFYYADVLVKIPPQGSKDKELDVSYFPYTSETPVYFQQGKVYYQYGPVPILSPEYQQPSSILTKGQEKAFMKAVASLYPQQITAQGNTYTSTPAEGQDKKLPLPEAAEITTQTNRYLPITYSDVNKKYETLYLDKDSLKKHRQFRNVLTVCRAYMYEVKDNHTTKSYVADILDINSRVLLVKLRLIGEPTATGLTLSSMSREGYIDDRTTDGTPNPSFVALKQALQTLR